MAPLTAFLARLPAAAFAAAAGDPPAITSRTGQGKTAKDGSAHEPAGRPPLLVPVSPPTPRRSADPNASPGIAVASRPWLAIPMPDGGIAWIRLPKLEERTQWQSDETFRRAEKLLRPDLDFDSRLMLGASPSFGRLMGGQWLHLSDEQIYVRLGRLPDGSLPLESGRGIYPGMFTTGAERLVNPNVLPGAHPPPSDILGH